MTSIGLNADLGEGMGTDDDLLAIVSSASIACGGHAGDAATIRRILKICKARGVRAGAHPGYNDPKRFGRFRLVMPLEQLLGQIRSQLFLVRHIAERWSTSPAASALPSTPPSRARVLVDRLPITAGRSSCGPKRR